MHRVWIGAIATLLAVGLISTAQSQTPGRVVAIGDIHGAGGVFRELLKAADLTDATGTWTGGTTTLVQTGDFTDRGPDVRQVMDLLMQLQRDASAAGGEVRVLLGNHEAMNLMGSVRDVTTDIYATFAADDSQEQRDAAYRSYRSWTERRETELGHPLPDVQTQEEWLADHPFGFLEYLDALGPDGHYGRWLRQRPIATRVGGAIFLHGGLHPDLPAASVDTLNEEARKELARWDEYREDLVDGNIILPFSKFEEILTLTALELRAWVTRVSPGPQESARSVTISADDQRVIDALIAVQGVGAWSVIDPNGPLWHRGFARWSPEEGESRISKVLERFDVTRIVVGHSVTSDRLVQAKFGGRVFLIDTGMLVGAYQGRASALELVGPQATAIYIDRREPLTAPTP